MIKSYILFKWFDEFQPTAWKLNFLASDHGTNGPFGMGNMRTTATEIRKIQGEIKELMK